MAAIANSLDRILQASVPRFAPATDRAFFVSPEVAIFKVTNGVASPSSFNFTPTLLNMAGTVTYVPSAGLAIAVNGNNFSLDYSNMTVAAGTVVATVVVDGVTYTRTINVSKLVDGIAPKILDLAASSQVFQINKAGAGSPGSIELVAYGQNLTGTPNFTILSGTATLAIGTDNTRKQLTLPNMSSDTVTVQVAQDGQVDTITIVKVREGADGANAVAGFLTNESQTVPANLDGSTISMAGATTTMKVYVGATDDSSNWTYTGSPASSATAITYTLGAANGVLTASALNAGVDAAYVDITAARTGYASVTKRFSLAKSKTGPQGVTGATGATGTRGNVNLSVITSGSAWSDAEANAAVLSFTGTAARAKDVVNLYRADRTWAQKRVFDGFNWSILADAFDGSILVNGSVISDALATGAVVARTMAVDAVTAKSIVVSGNGDNIIPDPKFKDLVWWGRVGAPVGDYTGMNNGWLGGAILLIQANGGVTRTSTSKSFATKPGASMFLEVQVELSNDYVGNFSIFFYVEGGSLYSMGCPNKSTWGAGNGDYPGWPIQFDGQSTKGRLNFNQSITIPLNSQCAVAHMVIIDQTVAGNVAIGSCSATRMADADLVVNGGVKARHIQTDTLSAIQAELGSAVISTSGSLRSGQTGYNAGPTGFYMGIDNGVPKLSMGVAGGKGIRWDGTNAIINGGLLFAPQIVTDFSITIPGINATSQNNTTTFVSFGTFTASTVNGVAPFRYQWILSVENGNNNDIRMVGDPTSSSIQIQAKGRDSFISANLSLTMVDSNQASAGDGAPISIQFGAGVPI